jgi:hypothetical protein
MVIATDATQGRWRVQQRVVAWALAILACMGWSYEARAECRKRVLLYIDKSQSMGQGPNSAFAQTQAVATELLQQPELAGDNSRVQVFLVGRTIEELARQQDAPPATRPEDIVTDLGNLLEHIQRQLGQDTATDRDIVIIASDFAHDPEIAHTRDADWRLQHWRRVLAGQRDTLRRALLPLQADSPSRAALVLIRAPLGHNALPADKRVSSDVLRDLGELQAREPLDVGTSAANPTAIARSIGQLFFVPPRVEVALLAAERLRVTAINQGCMPVTLVRAKIECAVLTSDSREAAFPAASSRLQGTASGVQRQAVDVDISGLDCRDRLYTAVVETKEADATKVSATTTSRLGYSLERAILAPEWWRERLELRVRLWGVITTPTEFEAAARIGSQDGPVIARGRVVPPRALEPAPERASAYRLVVPVNRDLRARILSDGVALTLEPAETGQSRTVAQDDLAGSAYQLFARLPLVLLGVGLTIWAVITHIKSSRGMLAAVERAATWWSLVSTLLPSLLLIATAVISGEVYEWTDWPWLVEARDTVGLAVAACVLSWAVWAAWKSHDRRRMRKVLGEGRPYGKSVEGFDRQTAFALPSTICAVAAALMLLVVFILHWTSPRRSHQPVATLPFLQD